MRSYKLFALSFVFSSLVSSSYAMEEQQTEVTYIQPKTTYTTSQEAEQDGTLFNTLMNKENLNKQERAQLQALVDGPENAWYPAKDEARVKIQNNQK